MKAYSIMPTPRKILKPWALVLHQNLLNSVQNPVGTKLQTQLLILEVTVLEKPAC